VVRSNSAANIAPLVFASDNRRSGDNLILAIIIAELELSNIDWSVFGVQLAEN
jgi:hypothetical protein